MSDLNLDKSQWRTFLEILGKDKNTVRLRSFYPKGHPLKNSDRGKKSNANIPWITQCQTEGRGIYVVVNDGEDTDSSIIGLVSDGNMFFLPPDSVVTPVFFIFKT